MRNNSKKWSIPTEYKGIMMRSKLETKWAKYFDENDIKWLYEPEGFQKDGVKYLPDFALPELKIMFEVKGIMDESDEKKKQMMAEICEENGWKYVMGFNEVGKSFLIDKHERQFSFCVAPVQEIEKHNLEFLTAREKEKKRPFEIVYVTEITLLNIYIYHPALRKDVLAVIDKHKENIDELFFVFLNALKTVEDEDFEDYTAAYFNKEAAEKIFTSQNHLREIHEDTAKIILTEGDHYIEERKKIKEIDNELEKLDKKILETEDEKKKKDLIVLRIKLTRERTKIKNERNTSRLQGDGEREILH